MPSKLLLEILRHWRDVRDKYRRKELKLEWEENMRCAVDIVEKLSAGGVNVPPELWRDNWHTS